jgi:hypothetical protein
MDGNAVADVPAAKLIGQSKDGEAMLDETLLGLIAQQMLNNDTVDLNGMHVPVLPTSTQHLTIVRFPMDGREYLAIEQNPCKRSRWGQLAKSGHRVVQFKDSEINKFVAAVVDGKVTIYHAGNRNKVSADEGESRQAQSGHAEDADAPSEE